MLLVLWVIRLLNGADITPGGQGVGFDCVIEFCFSPPAPPPPSSSSSFSGSWEEDFSVAAGRSGRGACLRFRSDHRVFSAHGSPWRPLQENVCVRVSAECVSVCVCVCLCGTWICVCASVFVPQSASVLCCAVTCSQISQRIYHPVNCLWVVDKMAPIHSHMKTLRG